MGNGYSLLCKGMFPLQSFLKCFYSGDTRAKRRAGVLPKSSCCLEKSAICNGQTSVNRDLPSGDVHLHLSTSAVCLKQPETLEIIEEGIVAVPPEEEIHQEDVVMVQHGIQPNAEQQPPRVFRPPIMAALKSNAHFNGSLESTDIEPVPHERTGNLQSKAHVKAAFQRHKEFPGHKSQWATPSAYVGNSTAIRVDTIESKTLSPIRSNAGSPNGTPCELTHTMDQDVEAGHVQNLRNAESDARCRQQRGLVRQNLLCIGSQDLPETIHVAVSGVHCRNTTSFLANGRVFTVITDNYTPPMDSILGSLGRSNRRMIEAQLQQNGDVVQCSKAGGTLPPSNVTSSTGKVESDIIKDGKMRWQESLTGVSKNLRVIIDELHKFLAYSAIDCSILTYSFRIFL